MADHVLELTLQNHPGAMSHVTGLFARRAFNLVGILCAPLPQGLESRVLLLVQEADRIPQILKQLEKLHDVRAARCRDDLDGQTFVGLLASLGGNPR